MITDDIKPIIEDILNAETNVADIIQRLTSEGYIPNNAKFEKLNWCILLNSAFRNLEIFTDIQINSLMKFYRKFMIL